MPRNRPYSPAEAAEHSKTMLRALATPERSVRRLEVARLFREGASIYRIAKALGIDRTTVTKDLERIAPDALAAYRAKLGKDAAERRARNVLIRRAHGRGNSLTAIAGALGITYQRIAQITAVAPLPNVADTREPAKVRDAPLDRPKRRCSNCGRTFQPTVTRRMLCAYCYRRGDPDGEE